MFCGECGNQIPEGANHCPECGTPVQMQPAAQVNTEPQPQPYVQQEPQPQPYVQPEPQPYAQAVPPAYVQPEKKQGKKTPVLIGVIAAVCIAVIAIGVFVITKALPAARLKKQIDNGNQALADGDYALAEESFLQALEMDPESADAQSGLETAYLDQAGALLKKKQYDKAIPVYQKLLDRSPKNNKAKKGITDAVTAQVDVLIENGDLDDALQLINHSVDEYKLKDLDAKKDGTLAGAEEVMTALYSAMEAGDYDSILELDDSPEANAIGEALSGTGRTNFLYSPSAAGSKISGKGAGLYLVVDEAGESHGYYLYYGDLKNGSREGSGISIWKKTDGGYEYYDGAFANDKPNGAGKTILVYPDEVTVTVETQYTDGLEDGDVTVTYNIQDDRMAEDELVAHYTATNGDAESIPKDVLEWITDSANNSNALVLLTQLAAGSVVYGVTEGYETGDYFWMTYNPSTTALGTVGYQFRE